MTRLTFGALLLLAGCYKAPGGPAPAGSAASRCFPALAARYAEIDRDAAGQTFKSHAEAFDFLKAKRHAALKAGFDDVAAEFDSHFEKDGDNLKWDADRFKAAINEEADGFSK